MSCVSRIVLRHVHVDVDVHVQINKSVVDFPLFNPNGSPLVARRHAPPVTTLTEHFDLESRNHDTRLSQSHRTRDTPHTLVMVCGHCRSSEKHTTTKTPGAETRA